MGRFGPVALVTLFASFPIALPAEEVAPPLLDASLMRGLQTLHSLDADNDGRLTPGEYARLSADVLGHHERDAAGTIDLAREILRTATMVTGEDWARLKGRPELLLSTQEAITLLGSRRARDYDSNQDGQLEAREVVVGRVHELARTLGVQHMMLPPGQVAPASPGAAPPVLEQGHLDALWMLRNLDADRDGLVTRVEQGATFPPGVLEALGTNDAGALDLSAAIRQFAFQATGEPWRALKGRLDVPATLAEAMPLLGRERARSYDGNGDGQLEFKEVLEGREKEVRLTLGLPAAGAAAPASPTPRVAASRSAGSPPPGGEPRPEGGNPIPVLLILATVIFGVVNGVRTLGQMLLRRFRAAPAAAPVAAPPVVMKARMYLRQNLVKPAIKSLQEALDETHDPAVKSEVRTLLAICFARRSEWVAVSLHRRALDPGTVKLEDLSALADLLEAGGQRAEFKEVLQQVVARDVGFKNAERRLKTLVQSEAAAAAAPQPQLPATATGASPAVANAAAAASAAASATGAVDDSALARVIPPRYRSARLLGEGGMAKVYLAQDTTLGRPVAIKILMPSAGAGFSSVSAHELKERFLREGRALAKLDHPGVVRVHDVSETDPPFLVMEYLAGQDLEDVLAAGPLEPARGIELFGQLARALAAIHAQGIIHRDLKPANIRCTADGQARIVDFGLAHSSELTALTRNDVRMGTFSFMAPEQLEDGRFDESTDLFSLGITMYLAFTGKRPFGSMASLHHPDPTPLHEEQPGVPRAISDAVMRMLKVRPQERLRTSRELLDVLARVAAAPGEVPVLGRLEELAEGPLHSLKGALDELHRQSGPTGARMVLGSPKGLDWLKAKVQRSRALIGPLLAEPPDALGDRPRAALTTLSRTLAEVWRLGLGLAAPELPPLELLQQLLRETGEGIVSLRGELRSHMLSIDEALLEAHRARCHPLALRWTGPGRELLVPAPDQVRTVLDEIVGNLLDNSRAVGARTVTLEVDEKDRDTLVIKLEDDGPGFGQSDPELPFQRGFTRRPGGTGLGLARCRSQARSLGGELAIGEPAAPGARLVLTLPRVCSGPAGPGRAAASAPA